MGLYMNNEHQCLFHNKEELQEKNQTISIHRHEPEWMKEQVRFHRAMEQELLQLRNASDRQHTEGTNKWNELDEGYQERFADLEKRMDTQDAFLDKIIRELDYFRGLLFERTYYIVEKIEEKSRAILHRDKEKIGQ